LGGVLGWVARWPSEVQWAFAAIFLAGCLAGALWGIDQLTRSSLDRLAAVEASETRIEGYRMEAMSSVADGDSASADRLFLRALVELREARSTTFGLFPRYDEEKLAEAQSLLQQAVEAADPDSFVGLESRFFLAKSYLAEERLYEARGELQVLARRDSRRAAESVKLLQDLQRVAPIATPDSLASPYD
jgi:inorganic triphosphatase YgiF